MQALKKWFKQFVHVLPLWHYDRKIGIWLEINRPMPVGNEEVTRLRLAFFYYEIHIDRWRVRKGLMF